MSDAACTLSDLPTADDLSAALVLGPDDDVLPLAAWAGRKPGERHALVLVVHRRHGTWTHLYRVSRTAAPRSAEVHLLRAAAGDRREEGWRRELTSSPFP